MNIHALINRGIPMTRTREEVVETITVSVEMGGGPATVYGGKALAAFDEMQA
jgi:hypothetical protein